MLPEQLAELFHETYERLAPAFGWKTKKGCHCKFYDLPERNRALMIATCQTVLNALQNSGAVANGQQHTQERQCSHRFVYREYIGQTPGRCICGAIVP